MNFSWQEILALLGVVGIVLGFYHTFVIDNVIREKIENDKATRAVIAEVVEKKLTPILNKINEIRLDITNLESLLAVRMANRKASIAELRISIKDAEEYYVDTLTEIAYTLSCLNIKMEEFIIYYNKFNSDKKFSEEVYSYVDHTYKEKHQEFINNIFLGGYKGAVRQAIKQKRESQQIESTQGSQSSSFKDTYS